MRVFCLATAFCSFLVERADSHVDGGRSNATLVTSESFSRLYNTVSESPGLLQLNGSMGAVASEERMPNHEWMFTVVNKLGFDYDQLMLRLKNVNNAFSVDEHAAVQAYVGYVMNNPKMEMKSRDHKVALDTLVAHERKPLLDGLEGGLDDERVQAQVAALLRAAANCLLPSSNTVAKELEAMKRGPEYALKVLGLVSRDALKESPNAAVQWLKYAVLFSKQKSAELAKAEFGEVRLKWYKRVFDIPEAKADVMAALMSQAARLLFENKPYDDVIVFIERAKTIPELKKWVDIMRKYVPKQSPIVEP